MNNTTPIFQSILNGICPPRFPITYCSQCGEEFGPGEQGYSHCNDHPGGKNIIQSSAFDDDAYYIYNASTLEVVEVVRDADRRRAIKWQPAANIADGMKYIPGLTAKHLGLWSAA